jgi:hypothetical protein
MNDTFFAETHTIDPELKDSEWAARIIYEHYYYGGAEGLLEGKNPQEIGSYVAGKQSVTKFKRMFRRAGQKQPEDGCTTPMPGKSLAGIDWEPLALLTQSFNSAFALVQKMLIYVKCIAIDPLAREKKGKDYDYLSNCVYLEASLATFSQKLQAHH